MGHTDAPHIVEVLHTNWVELLVATAHFIHVHTVDITLHANRKVDLFHEAPHTSKQHNHITTNQRTYNIHFFTYFSTVSPLFRSGASVTWSVGCVFRPGTPWRTVVGGVLAQGPWAHEFRRSVKQPSKEFRPFQQIGNTALARENPLLGNGSCTFYWEFWTFKNQSQAHADIHVANLESGSLQFSRKSLRCVLVS